MSNPSPTRVALLTGAGSGIGRATALRLAADGVAVFGADVNGAALEETTSLVREAGGTMTAHEADLGSARACRATIDACMAEFDQLDILGNIAGIARADHVTDVDEDMYRRMFAINADACFFLAQAAVPHLLHPGGNIVNIASNAGLMGQAYTVVYCMTKGAVVQLTRALAMEFMRTPLRVNAIAPAGTSTNLVATYQMPSDVDGQLLQRYVGFRGLGTAEGVAHLFAFVVSDEALQLHGAILSCDGGITAG